MPTKLLISELPTPSVSRLKYSINGPSFFFSTRTVFSFCSVAASLPGSDRLLGDDSLIEGSVD